MAEPRTVVVAARVTRAEHAAWKDKAAAAGVSPSVLLRQAMARTRTWTALALAPERERTRQIVRLGNNLNQLARWANTHASAVEAVTVIANLVSFERSLLTLASPPTPSAFDSVPRPGSYRAPLFCATRTNTPWFRFSPFARSTSRSAILGLSLVVSAYLSVHAVPLFGGGGVTGATPGATPLFLEKCGTIRACRFRP